MVHAFVYLLKTTNALNDAKKVNKVFLKNSFLF